jgi:serine/threonine-protein kinase
VALGFIFFSAMQIWFRATYIGTFVIALFLVFSVKELLSGERVTKQSLETNRLLGLSFQSQGLLDLAFDKFKKLPFDNETKDLFYNLGLEYERKRMINKALEAYERANKGGGFRDLDDRIPKLKDTDKSSTLGSHTQTREPNILGEASIEAVNKLGRYDILGTLGKGSMGLVYKALDPKINRLLAIKTIRFSEEFDEDVISEIKERFFREAEIAGQLSHPSIVTIYDVGEHADLTYMAMEFLEGNDLENYISKKNLLPFRKVLYIVGRVADALHYAHKHDVIHRDIKPANIMLLNTGGVKVTDFGIAKAISSSRTKTGVILGTPNYMSPEQIMGQKIDQRSDIFSLGVLFFQLLAGETPFHGDNLSSLLYQITQVKHPAVREYNPRIPKVCEKIVDKALAKNPKTRFKTAGEMAQYIKLLASKVDQLMKRSPQ